MPNTRTYNWRHNALRGSACRSRMDYQIILRSPSATSHAKDLAAHIQYLQAELYQELSTYRINQDGSLSTIKESQ